MPLIDMQGAIVPDPWIEGERPARVPADPLLLPLTVIGELSAGEIGSARPIGVRIQPGGTIDRLVPVLDQLDLIVIEFPSFRDGRGFTLATTLRNRHGFSGELRAAGHLLPDQLMALRRCGFTAIETPANHPPEAWRSQVPAQSGGPLLKRLLVARGRATLHLRS